MRKRGEAERESDFKCVYDSENHVFINLHYLHAPILLLNHQTTVQQIKFSYGKSFIQFLILFDFAFKIYSEST